ncbi:MAG TPA: polysaccharide lyase beta-sandwich domain-containing protein [Thermoanaerobaculia bacterium]|nr:polysaccharide lyase beta-sandwich domain-containing protein [Thermoanaerobaculia bacterium]
MAQWASSRPLAIGANNDTVSAVRDLRTNALGITFWRPGSFEGIQSSAQAVVYLTFGGNTMQLHAADPNNGNTGSFQITVPGAWNATGATSTRTSRSTTLTIPRNGGQTTSVVLTKAGTTKKRSVRR